MKDYDKLVEKTNNSLGELFHQHLLIRAFINNPPREAKVLESWLAELVGKIGMKIVIGPFAKYVEAEGNAGLTGAVIIETSHIASHIWDEPSPAMIQLDVYSCSHFDPAIIVQHLDAFDLVAHEKMVIDRNNQFVVKHHSVA